METIIDLKKHANYLEFIASGQYSLDVILNKFQMILDTCRFTGFTKILINVDQMGKYGSDSERGLSAVGAYNLYQKYLESGGHDLKFAFFRKFKFENELGFKIAKSQKSPVKLFHKRTDALEWLEANK